MRAPDYQTLYQFEPMISATLFCLFNDANLVSKSIKATPEFQSGRPRVENIVHVGARFDNHYILDAQGIRRENGWDASFHLDVITWSDEAIHFAYLAAVRELASRLDQMDLTVAPAGWDDQAGKNPFIPLAYHEISQIKSSGTVPLFEPEKGTYQSKLTFDFQFAILPDAWPFGLFNLPPPPPVVIIDALIEPVLDETGAVQTWPFRDQVTGRLGYLQITDGLVNWVSP